MSDRHVVPAEAGWQVEKADAKRPSAKAPTQAEAIARAVEIVANDGGGQVVVHGTDGAVRETRTVAAGAEDTALQAAGTAVSAAAAGATATAGKAADAVGETADAVTDDARRTAGKVGDTAAEVGDGVGERLEDASHRAGSFIHSFTERAASPIDSATRALNPVRIAGRTAGAVVAGALHVGAVVSSRGTRRAQHSARLVTGRR